MAVTEIGELHRREQRRCAGVEIYVQIRRVIGQVVGIDPAAIPNRLVDSVGGTAGPAAIRELPDAVDEFLAGGRIPGVDRVGALGRVVRAVHRLQRENIVGHVGLRISVRLVGVAGRRRSADIAAIAHDGVFAVVMRGRHRDVGRTAGLLAVLEAEGVAELVQRGREIVIAELRLRVIVVRAEPDVATGRVVAGVVGVGGRIGRRGLRDHDVGAVGPGVLDVGGGVAED